MYKPKLRYVFCVMRERSLWTQLLLIKYLNSFGISPYLVYDRVEDRGKSNRAVELTLEKSGVKFEDGRDVVRRDNPDYDVMFSESSGFSVRFEKIHLMESKRKGKINIKLNNAVSICRDITNPNYTTEHVKDTLNGMCMKGQRTIEHYQKFVENLFFINVGDSDWDIFETDNFKAQVKQINEKYGNKILLIGSDFGGVPEEISWDNQAILQAQKMGFKVIVRVHVGREKFIPDSLKEYVDLETPRFVLFAASSHVIENIASTMLAECLFLNKRVGCSALIPHPKDYGSTSDWVTNYDEWKKRILPKAGKEICDIIPRAVSEEELDKFLSSNEAFANQNKIDNIFGWKRVPNYCSQTFEEIEKKLT